MASTRDTFGEPLLSAQLGLVMGKTLGHNGKVLRHSRGINDRYHGRTVRASHICTAGATEQLARGRLNQNDIGPLADLGKTANTLGIAKHPACSW
jgi:hypothetical protein